MAHLIVDAIEQREDSSRLRAIRHEVRELAEEHPIPASFIPSRRPTLRPEPAAVRARR